MNKFSIILPKVIIFLIMVSAFLLMLGPAKQDSAIMDELAHIPAGYSYVKFFDYRLNPEHPPLIKAFSAIPLLFQSSLNFPTSSDAWQNQVNSQWDVGNMFLYESGNNADKIIFYSRLFPMLLMLILIGFTYFWANELLGRWWALLPAALVAFSPNFLAHGHYVTTDIGSSLGFLIGIYFFLKSINSPSKKNTIIAGLAFGFAQLLKFSTILLAPLFIAIVAIVFIEKVFKEIKSPVIENKLKKILKYFWKDFSQLVLTFIIGGLLIYAVYFVFTFNYPIEKQFSDTNTILQSFGNRFLANINLTMSHNIILRPIGEYFLGILMVMQRSAGGNTFYFLNQVLGTGSWYYFPLVFLMKESLPALIIIFFAIFMWIYEAIKNATKGKKAIKNSFIECLTTNFSESCMLIFILGYWVYSIQSNLNIGFRHIMPTLPFIYILSTQMLKKWFNTAPQKISNGFTEKLSSAINKIFGLGIKFLLLSILLVWLLVGTYISRPFYLSRFNEFFGGMYGGYQYVTDSNFDWGQDLKRLKEWVDNPPVDPTTGQKEKVEKIAIDYFGGGNTKYYFGGKAENWNSAAGNPIIENNIKWLAISANSIQGATAESAPDFKRNPQDEYLWLKNPLSPNYKAGTSIFIYKLME